MQLRDRPVGPSSSDAPSSARYPVTAAVEDENLGVRDGLGRRSDSRQVRSSPLPLTVRGHTRIVVASFCTKVSTEFSHNITMKTKAISMSEQRVRK